MSFGTGSFYNKSSKQTLVATSSTHAEVKALYSLLTDIKFVAVLCNDLGRPLLLPSKVYEDNLSVIQLCDNAHIKKSKHYLMTINYIKEAIAAGTIELLHIDTHLNPADALSKPLAGAHFSYKTQKLMGHGPGDKEISPPPSQRQK
jgi:hypothetical protein